MNKTVEFGIVISIISLISCHNNTATSVHNDYDIRELINNLPCKDSSYHLYSVNVSTSDFCENGRTHSLLSLCDSMKNQGFSLNPHILIGKSEYTSYMKRLARVNGLQDIVMVIHDDTIRKIRDYLETTRPLNILVCMNSSQIEIGDIVKPKFKQMVFSTIYAKPKSEIFLKDSILRIHSNSDTIIELKNIGNNKLYIYDIDSSCECNNIFIDKTRIGAGETAQLYISHKSNGLAKAQTNILIYSNDSNGIKQIVIEASN